MRPEVHGHRGCEGAFPPNTIPAFLHATSLGCQWLEMDVVITGDGKVLVSHEPWMDPHSCLKPDGTRLSEEDGRAINIFQLPLDQVQAYPCVPSGGNVSSPQADWHKPTLAEVVHATDRQTAAHGSSSMRFNIEIKSEPALYDTYQPRPRRFAELVLSELVILNIMDRCLVQSFDTEVLEAVHAMAPEIPLALLVENKDGLEADLDRLGFKPNYYSPSFFMANAEMKATLRDRGIGLLVWTVNDASDMLRMLDLGVDGLITDRPAEALALIAARQ